MKLTALTAALALTAGAVWAQDVAPTDVSYSEYGEVATPLTAEAGDAERGMQVFSQRSQGNCVACHVVEQYPDIAFQGEVGPPLSGVGGYRSAEELRGIVANAKMTFPDTVMPAFYKTTGFIRPGDAYTGKAASGDLPPILSAQQIEDVVAFLLTLQEG
ncbi:MULTISPECIES: sulfur oxidation c-type cytochrome SoxX [Ponticoccus]|uniref:Sulfur oxidation c-type cytochrome SoxX n=1 Tax=Ponticoccus litoralis TaxID=422297 RepID=A0AAW9SFT8_9RHOB|nr:sulfur oxidation c-type cytochrome SoxX [Enemella evansiae]